MSDVDDELSPEEIASIEASIKSGITFRIDWGEGDYRIIKIMWQKEMLGKPADPNELVDAILKHVTTEGMVMELDGQNYHVRKI